MRYLSWDLNWNWSRLSDQRIWRKLINCGLEKFTWPTRWLSRNKVSCSWIVICRMRMTPRCRRMFHRYWRQIRKCSRIISCCRGRTNSWWMRRRLCRGSLRRRWCLRGISTDSGRRLGWPNNWRSRWRRPRNNISSYWMRWFTLRSSCRRWMWNDFVVIMWWMRGVWVRRCGITSTSWSSVNRNLN